MRRRAIIFLTAVMVTTGLISGGCVIIKKDHGLHKGHYKQQQKADKKGK